MRNRGTERLSDWPKVTELVSGRARVPMQMVRLRSSEVPIIQYSSRTFLRPSLRETNQRKQLVIYSNMRGESLCCPQFFPTSPLLVPEHGGLLLMFSGSYQGAILLPSGYLAMAGDF